MMAFDNPQRAIYVVVDDDDGTIIFTVHVCQNHIASARLKNTAGMIGSRLDQLSADLIRPEQTLFPQWTVDLIPSRLYPNHMAKTVAP